MKLGIREIIVFALLLAFLGGSYQLGFRRLQAQREHYLNDVRQKQAMLASLGQRSASVADLEEQLARLKKTVDVFERKLPKQKEVDQILGDVWKLAEQNSLRPQSVKPDRVDRAGDCSEQPIELVFEGPFNGFFSFLRALEGSDRIIRVTEIDLRRLSDESPSMTAKLTLNIYFEPDRQPTPLAASASVNP